MATLEEKAKELKNQIILLNSSILHTQRINEQQLQIEHLVNQMKNMQRKISMPTANSASASQSSAQVENAAVNKQCILFKKGHCRFGRTCRFSHSIAQSNPANNNEESNLMNKINSLADTGSTHLLLRMSDARTLALTVDSSQQAHRINLPNNSYINSIGISKLNISPEGPILIAHIFLDNDLQQSLLSISELCNEGCRTTFTATEMMVSRNGKVILRTAKHPNDKLWPVNLSSFDITAKTSPEAANDLSHLSNGSNGQTHLAVHHELNADYVGVLARLFRQPRRVNISPRCKNWLFW